MDPILSAALFAVALLGVGAGVYLVLKSQARSAVNAHLVIESASVKQGEPVRLQVHVRPRREVQVERVVARTRCLRRSVEGRGRDELGWLEGLLSNRPDDTWVEHDEVARSEIEVTGRHTFRPGHPESFQAEVPLADGLPTDESGPLTIRWVLEVQFCIPGFPDATLSRPFKVGRRF